MENHWKMPEAPKGKPWQGEIMALAEIRPNPKNPRTIKDDKFQKLVRSIRDSPWMMYLLPIVVDGDGIVLNGNQRRDAAMEAGYTHVPVLLARDLTEEQRDELVIKANTHSGEWVPDLLAENFDQEQLGNWGLDVELENEAGSDKGKDGPEEKDLRPYTKTHFLISVAPEQLAGIAEHLEAIKKSGVDFHQTSN